MVCILEEKHQVLFPPHMGESGTVQNTLLWVPSLNTSRNAVCQVYAVKSSFCATFQLCVPGEEVALWRARTRNDDLCLMAKGGEGVKEMLGILLPGGCVACSPCVYLIFSLYHCGRTDTYCIPCVISPSIPPYLFSCSSRFGYWGLRSWLLCPFDKARR